MKHLYLIITILGMIQCNRKEENLDFGSAIEKNTLAIYKDSKLRLSFGKPYLETKKYAIQTVSMYGKDSSQIASFTTDLSIKPIEIELKAFPNQSAFIVSISTNGNQSLSGKDCIGISFDSIPSFEIGNSFYKYGNVKAWTYPKQILSIDSLNITDNQFFYWKYSDSLYAAMMPLIGNGYVSTIGKDENGHLCAKSKCLIDNFEAKNVPLVVIAFDKNPYKLFEKIYEIGFKSMNKEQSLRKNKTYPAKFEKLLWCTWNSFMHTVDEKIILLGLESFKKKGFTLPNLLIDDGWSQVSAYGTGMLQSLEVEKTKFPKGLKNLVSIAKTKYGVENVGVWHAFNGYWAGIDPKSEMGIKYKNLFISYQDKVAWTEKPIETFYSINPKNELGFQFYDDWYNYLKNEGISFVKVDNQLVADRICSNNIAFSIGAANLQNNMQKAVKKHFDGHVINCMDMTTDAVYNYGNSAVARSSEDFFPENNSYKMSAGNAAIHVLCNAYNSTWWSQMVYPDYDMFQSHHPQAEFHAVARAISGGPIYITDTPGEQNMDIITKLIYKNGAIIRADQPALPTEDCLFNVSDSKPFKMFTTSNGVGILAIFNVADADSVKGNFKISDIPNLKSENFILYNYFTKNAIKSTLSNVFQLNIARLKQELFFAIPYNNEFAAIGLVEKYNAPKTVSKVSKINKSYRVELVEKGKFAAYSEIKPSSIEDSKGKNCKFTYINNLIEILDCDSKFMVNF